MRKLKLQVQITLDGYIAGPNGEMDWMWTGGTGDDTVTRHVIELADACDTILMGRKMSRVFLDHWENVTDNEPDSSEMPLATRMVDLRKIIFSRTETSIKGRNVEVENGDLETVVNSLKSQPGKDIMVYGGGSFLSSLIDLDLVDEFYLFICPVTLGSGMSIFTGQKPLKLESTTVYKSGKVLHKYIPA